MSEIPPDPAVKIHAQGRETEHEPEGQLVPARVMSRGQMAEREALNRAITSESLRKRTLQLANGRARELGLRTAEEVRRALAIPPPKMRVVGVTELCQACGHDLHEPGRCKALIGTGYLGYVQCRCS